MAEPRYLTKSRFKLGCECPTKLFYTSKKGIYADKNLDDPFLKSLADGGFQVGELAKHYFPGGVEIGRPANGGYEAPAAETRRLIEQGDVTLYEAAFQADDLFIYADIIERRGDVLNLYEVKAKSIDPEKDQFLNKNTKKLLEKWGKYLLDAAFQKFVIRRAFPDLEIKAHLVLADKSSRCPTDGLNQKFRVKPDGNGRMHVLVSELSADDIAERILYTVNVDAICDGIFDGTYYTGPLGLSFEGTAMAFAEHYARDMKFPPQPSKACRDCEFQASHDDLASGLKSGFRECWTEHFGWSDEDFGKPTVLDVWDFRGKDELIAEKRARMVEVAEIDLKPKDDGRAGLSRTARQWRQVAKAASADESFYLDKENLAPLMRRTFPLHFIDFETSRPAIPFNKGRRPYENIAFQFSHHVIYEDGAVEHKGQFLNASPGVFPSYEFIRELKKDLEKDGGTIFRYATHENTVLNEIYEQLTRAGDVPDCDELQSFIRDISKSKNGAAEPWEGPRNMVDMLELVKRFYYDPYTGGSNSIKLVLPAILNRSPYLQAKYSRPIYGAHDGIKSLNYIDQTWVKFKDGKVIDPYKLLPKMFQNISDKDFEQLMGDIDEVRDGGAALTAYAKLQFEEMSSYERAEIESALLKYCELDTLAMVMIYEGWRDLLEQP